MGILDSALEPDRGIQVDPANAGWGSVAASFGVNALKGYDKYQNDAREEAKHAAAMQELAARLKHLDLQTQGAQNTLDANKLKYRQQAIGGLLAGGTDAGVRDAAAMVPQTRALYGKLAGVNVPEVAPITGAPSGPVIPVQGPAAPASVLYPQGPSQEDDGSPLPPMTSPDAEYGGAMPGTRANSFANPQTIAAIRSQAFLPQPAASKPHNVAAGGAVGHYDASGQWVTDFTAPYQLNPNTHETNATRKEIAEGNIESREGIAGDRLAQEAAKLEARQREAERKWLQSRQNAADRREYQSVRNDILRRQANAKAGLPPSANANTSPYAPLIEAAARKYNIDPEIIHRQIMRESAGNPTAKSPAGALGLMQLMPGTAKDMGLKDPTDPAQAIDAGVRYLAMQRDYFKGDMRKALAAYNAGPGAVEKYARPPYKGIPPYAETQGYLKVILGDYTGDGKYRSYAPAAKESSRYVMTPDPVTKQPVYQHPAPGMPAYQRPRYGEVYSKAEARYQNEARKAYPSQKENLFHRRLDPNITEDAQILAARDAHVEKLRAKDEAQRSAQQGGVNPVAAPMVGKDGKPLDQDSQDIMMMLDRKRGAK